MEKKYIVLLTWASANSPNEPYSAELVKGPADTTGFRPTVFARGEALKLADKDSTELYHELLEDYGPEELGDCMCRASGLWTIKTPNSVVRWKVLNLADTLNLEMS